MEFISPLKENINLGLMYKIIPTEGNLAWEYNPLRNYRITESKYYFRGKFLSKELLEKELGFTGEDEKITSKDTNWDRFKKSEEHPMGISDYEDDPIFYDKNLLTDFDTDELEFDVNHPVDILPLYSYDGSVNLIINDGKNPPRLINSRFSPLGRSKYLIVDRKGDNDTNIYDLGSLFNSDTSLYKTYVGIPELNFINVYNNGNLPIGNYHFYFKYVDADGNETDFVAESGLVSIFKGTHHSTVHTGFRDENSHKSVKFILNNIDSAYLYVSVYYTRSTSDINQNAVTTAHKINSKFLVNNSLLCLIYITGNEDSTEISLNELNSVYLIADNVKTLVSCLNMLFFGNVTNLNLNYKELSDLSLRFKVRPDSTKKYSPVPHDYNNVVEGTYTDPKFIYDYTGYLNHEIYRFGIVYLMNNGTLSPVFNIRGMFFQNNNDKYSEFNIYNGDNRNYITYNEETGIIYINNKQKIEKPKTEDASTESSSTKNLSTESPSNQLENIYGVVRIESGEDSEINSVIGIKIEIDDKEKLFLELNKYLIKGYFFVRLKRIPLRICLALTIGVDRESNTPLLYTDSSIEATSKSKEKIAEKDPNKPLFIAERFLSDDRVLTLNLEDRLYCISASNVNKYGAICPEYDINGPYLNSIFCGEEYIVELVTESMPLQLDKTEIRHLYIDNPTYINNNSRPCLTSKVAGVEDNTKLIEVGTKLFSARAGEAEEAFRYEYVDQEIKSTESSNLLRGSFGPYLALSGYKYPGTIINIYIKDYLSMNKLDLFKIRINDKSPYYAISDRYDITLIPTENLILYRGDTYICTFTHRFNRNFLDPSSPVNHKVVDENCWKNNYLVSDGVVKKESFDKINLGDVNAVRLGMWVTFSLTSSYNLNVRSLDESNTDETALTGHSRGFYPYYGMLADGSYKTPESLCLNKGFSKYLSERYNFEVPDVPAIKNDFTNRICYSDIHINDAFKNGFRTFLATHYRDYPKTYGQITKLIELQGNLVCVFEHGIAIIPVNERAVAGEGAGGNVFINTSNVLPENPKIISDTFGSLWKDSIIKTPLGIYGVDTIGKKIWRTNGKIFECISDFKVLEFLNLNISLSERELDPIIGIRNVKTHYNKFKRDVMFTFYDNLYGFEEKVWNLCYNELQQKWITFYSWVPSYSENIYNLYFSFDRNTSKWITKLGISNAGNDFSDGVVLTKNIIPNDAKGDLENNPGDNYIEYEIPNPNYDKEKPESDENPRKLKRYGYIIGRLDLANRTLPSGDGIEIVKDYELVPDTFGNWKNFGIDKNLLYLKTDAVNLCSELFVRGTKTGNSYNKIITNPSQLKSEWIKNCINSNVYCICKDDLGRRINLDLKYNESNIVTLLNIKANILVTYEGQSSNLVEAYTSGFQNNTLVNAGYYLSTVAVMPEYNMQFLTTDFWLHGLAGIIDIADKIYPTYWYGKQHPFEFEFIVADNPLLHKIFDNLEIISNSAEPESFHYEIIGDCYEFSKDKKNMYIRQEATKELYLYNGSNILFDSDYVNLDSEHRKRYMILNGAKIELLGYDKSTLFPLYYCRRDDFNNIEDYYHLKDGTSLSKDFSALSGAEIVKYPQEYRIWNHAKAIDIADDTKGRMRGNMQYKEDKWYVLINPINFVLKNEPAWVDLDNNETDKIPVELNLNPLPDDILSPNGEIYPPPSFTEKKRGYILWNWEDSLNKEVKIKDKWIKIRIRYKGNKLAIITAIKTLYSASYS